MLNSVHRLLPDYIKGYGEVIPYQKDSIDQRYRKTSVDYIKHSAHKIRNSLKELFRDITIQDGMTISFHHHLRNGDYVLNLIMSHLAELDIKNITVAVSSIFPVHEPLVEHIRNGVVTKLVTNYMSGPVADAVSLGLLKYPVTMHTHGGRARAIESGDLSIDIAFIAAPTADTYGNVNGVQGPAACGTLGYALADAKYAKQVVAVTDHLVDYPAAYVEIHQDDIDYVVVVDSIGDPEGIVSGTTQITKDPIGLKIASDAVKIIEASGLLKDGFSFQTGAGGTSLAVAHYLKEVMKRTNTIGSFASGGITGYLVDMFHEGLFKVLLDVQCFDLKAIESIKDDVHHQSMSASKYGNPHNKGAVVNQLDVMILGATEIDTNFNVNVTTGSNGSIMGGSGGHSDTAAGSKLSIVVTQLVKGRIPIVTDRVTTVTTPGYTIDVLVTERGIAVNPRNIELKKKLISKGINLIEIEELKNQAYKISGEPEQLNFEDQIIAVVEYRDGSVIDVVRKVSDE
jgi:citrate lyase subunit alpha/citrate CoA-transferase